MKVLIGLLISVNVLFHLIQQRLEVDVLQDSFLIQQYQNEVLSLAKKDLPLTLISNANEILGTIREGVEIPLYTLGEYYLAVCGAQGIQNLPVCFKLQNMRIGKYEVVSNDELPFYGVLVAKKGDKYWYPLVEVYDKTKEIGYQSNLPYALWIDNGRLLLSIVFIGNGGGSGEGTESVVVLGENGNWELIGCYYYIPDIYGHEGNLRFSYKNYTNSVNYISTLLKGFTSYPLEQCDHSVQVGSINHSFGL